MNKRVRNLIILITIMLLAVVALCACIAEQQPATEGVGTTTTSPGYGVAGWDDTEETAENDSDITSVPTEQGSEAATEASVSTVDTTPGTNATTPATGDDTTTPAAGSLDYEQFMNLSASAQQAYALAFPSVEEYIIWFNAEKAKYNDENGNNDVIEVTGPIDLGELNENKS